MEALNNILNRVSARELSSPHPNADEMELIYKAALRAPDHAWLRPSTFIEVKDEALDRLSKIFVKYGESLPDISDEILKKYQNAPYRAPMVIVLITNIKEHPKVPALEQMLSTATAAQNILLALNALNYFVVRR